MILSISVLKIFYSFKLDADLILGKKFTSHGGTNGFMKRSIYQNKGNGKTSNIQ